jgi:uncharacterized protein with PQ loop repeat
MESFGIQGIYSELAAPMTRIKTSRIKNKSDIFKGRLVSFFWPVNISLFSFSLSSFLKINAIKSPISIDIPTAPMTRASPILYPNTLAVKIIARILMAGPENRKVVAGPIPAPRL